MKMRKDKDFISFFDEATASTVNQKARLLTIIT